MRVNLRMPNDFLFFLWLCAHPLLCVSSKYHSMLGPFTVFQTDPPSCRSGRSRGRWPDLRRSNRRRLSSCTYPHRFAGWCKFGWPWRASFTRRSERCSQTRGRYLSLYSVASAKLDGWTGRRDAPGCVRWGCGIAFRQSLLVPIRSGIGDRGRCSRAGFPRFGWWPATRGKWSEPFAMPLQTCVAHLTNFDIG